MSHGYQKGHRARVQAPEMLPHVLVKVQVRDSWPEKPASHGAVTVTLMKVTGQLAWLTSAVQVPTG